MDGAVVVILISLAMFVGCFLLGLIPLLVNFSQVRTEFKTEVCEEKESSLKRGRSV